MHNQEKKFVELLIDDPSEQLVNFTRVLDSRIIGQESGKAAASRAIRRARNPLRNRRGPVYKLLQIGQSRTGKTLTAESTAEALHGSPEAMVKVDCGNYQQDHQVSQLLGAPPAYIGYRDPNAPVNPGHSDTSALLSQINLENSRRGSNCPYIVVLFDEIEKCSDALLDILLSIYDTGKIRLSNNTEVDFTKVIFFMTSNLAMDQVEQLSHPIGLRLPQKGKVTEKDIASVVYKELRRRFRPEFLKRIDETVIFAPLTEEQLAKVVELELKQLYTRMLTTLKSNQLFTLQIDDTAKAFLLAEATKDDGGVAEIKHMVERYIVDVLGNELDKRTIGLGDLVRVSHKPGKSKLTFECAKDGGLITQADKLDVRRKDTPEARKGLAFQRRIELSTMRSLSGIYSLQLEATEFGPFSDVSSALCRDLHNKVFGAQLLSTAFTYTVPYRCRAIVRANAEQIEEMKLRHPNLTVETITEPFPSDPSLGNFGNLPYSL